MNVHLAPTAMRRALKGRWRSIVDDAPTMFETRRRNIDEGSENIHLALTAMRRTLNAHWRRIADAAPMMCQTRRRDSDEGGENIHSPPPVMHRTLAALFYALAIAALVACGGGGGSSPVPTESDGSTMEPDDGGTMEPVDPGDGDAMKPEDGDSSDSFPMSAFPPQPSAAEYQIAQTRAEEFADFSPYRLTIPSGSELMYADGTTAPIDASAVLLPSTATAVDKDGAPFPLPDGGSDTLPASAVVTLPDGATITLSAATNVFNDRHLRAIKASAAYARGATGAGEQITVVDTGIRDTHLEFAKADGADADTDPDPDADKLTVEPLRPENADYTAENFDRSHGTAVASVAAGKRNGIGMHGVAFDAALHFAFVKLGSASDGITPFDLDGYDETAPGNSVDFYGAIVRIAEKAGSSVINMSFGIPGSGSSFSRELTRNKLARTAALLAQADADPADRKVLVWSAGNGGNQRYTPESGGGPVEFDSPSVFPSLAASFEELQGHALAVVALNQDGTITGFSNRCGIAKAFCLAAPGASVLAAYSSAAPPVIGDDSSDDAYATRSGTSFSAPIVAGAFALLRQYFRGQVGNTELVNRMLATADGEGIYADADTYGHGVLDLDAATSPVGAVMSGLPGTPGNQPLASAELTLSGGAFGASLQQQLQNIEIAGFDSLGAPFFQSAANFNPAATPRSWRAQTDAARRNALQLALQPAAPNDGAQLALHLDRNGAVASARIAAGGWFLAHGDSSGQMLGLRDDPLDGAMTFAAPHLSLVRDGIGFGWARGGGGFALMRGAPQFDGEHASGGENGFGMLLAVPMRFGDASRRGGAFGSERSTGLWLQAGALREGDGFLGARPQGLLGRARGATWFAGVNGAWDIAARDNARKPWRLSASAYLGRTRADLDGGFLRDGEDLRSSAFSLGAARGGLWRRGDRLDLRLSQPLRVERGGITLRAPAGRTRYGAVVHRSHDVSLAPSGRALRAGATYRIGLAGGALASTLGIERHPQHDRARNADMFASIRFERRF